MIQHDDEMFAASWLRKHSWVRYLSLAKSFSRNSCYSLHRTENDVSIMLHSERAFSLMSDDLYISEDLSCVLNSEISHDGVDVRSVMLLGHISPCAFKCATGGLEFWGS